MEKNNSKICAVIAGGEQDTLAGIDTADFIVAADKGYFYARESGVTPDLIVGDFDSYCGDLPEGDGMLDCDSLPKILNHLDHKKKEKDVQILRLPKVKDDSDLLATLRQCLAFGYRDFRIYCALGGRLDHLLANLQACSYVAMQDANIKIIGKDEKITFLHNTSQFFPQQPGYSLSVLALSEIADGVSIKNAVYELENAILKNTFPIGLSNEWKNGSDVEISVKHGVIAVITSRL